jgi:hypothetical protein
VAQGVGPEFKNPVLLKKKKKKKKRREKNIKKRETPDVGMQNEK